MPHLYFNIDIQLTIAERYRFFVVHSIKINSSIETLSDTAEIVLPREFKNAVVDDASLSLERKRLLDYIKPGDSVKVEVGYDGALKTEFEGYVTEVGAEIPTVLKCEDEMYKLRKSKLINKTYSKVSLSGLLTDIAPGYKIEALDINLGKMTIENATAYKVLERLKQDYGIRAFFKGKTLFAGLTIDLTPAEVFDFTFGKNVRKSSSLVYKTKEGKQLYIKATSMQKGGGKISHEFGVPGESEITLHAPINLSKSELKSWCEKYWESKVFDGYEGSVDGWALPQTVVGTTANLTDPNYPDGHRDGQYFIEEVVTTIDASVGVKRENRLSFKIKGND